MAEVNLQVAASSDDCSKDDFSHDWSTAYANTYLAYDAPQWKRYGSAFRFLNVAIPQGATITAAYLTIRASINRSGTAVNSRIRAQAADNPITFSTLADFDARAWTTAYVHWDNIPAWTANTDYQGPDISSVIQEIINRAGWVSGNALVILHDDFEGRSTQAGYCERLGYSYDGSATYAPKLHIEYTPPGGAVGRSVAYIIG